LKKSESKNFTSDFSGKQFPVSEKIHGSTIRQSLLNLIQAAKPEFTKENTIAASELNTFREQYVADFIGKKVEELSELEKSVLYSVKDRSIISDKLDDDDAKLSLGQRLADTVADFGGSWTFISIFTVFIFFWILGNVLFLSNKGFDPYPFILLNLILSCIAAVQAPVIMMSQNRQEEKDRMRAKKDYMINLKSELEIRILHEKIDHLIIHQQEELLEIQRVQIEMMNDILERIK